MDKDLIPAFGRTGSKARLRHKIHALMPKEFSTYIEPFVGGGSVFLGYKFKPGQRAVLNDKDADLMSGWRVLKNPPSGVNWKQYDTNNLAKLQSFADSKSNSGAAGLVKQIVISRNTFSGKGDGKLYQTTSPYDKLKKIDEYKAKLKDTKILSQDYGSVISSYDRPNNFFYFDPPYAKSDEQGVYKLKGFDVDKFAQRLRKMKAKWMVSLDDSAHVRQLFKGFKIRGLTLPAAGRAIRETIGSKPRKEVIITNY
jgi:DNA adenine methylase